MKENGLRNVGLALAMIGAFLYAFFLAWAVFVSGDEGSSEKDDNKTLEQEIQVGEKEKPAELNAELYEVGDYIGGLDDVQFGGFSGNTANIDYSALFHVKGKMFFYGVNHKGKIVRIQNKTFLVTANPSEDSIIVSPLKEEGQ